MAFQEAVFKFLYRHKQKKPHNIYLRENVLRGNMVEKVELIFPNSQRSFQSQGSEFNPNTAHPVCLLPIPPRPRPTDSPKSLKTGDLFLLYWQSVFELVANLRSQVSAFKIHPRGSSWSHFACSTNEGQSPSAPPMGHRAHVEVVSKTILKL